MEDLHDALEAYLDRVIGPLPDGAAEDRLPEGRVPIVKDDFMASRMVRKHQHLQDQMAARHAVIAQWAQVEAAFKAGENAKTLKQIAMLEDLLRGYAEALREAGKFGRSKGYSLPGGRLQFRHQEPVYEIAPGEEQAFLQWCSRMGFVTVTIEPDLERAQAWFRTEANQIGDEAYVEYMDESTGEMIQERVPGAMLARPEGESFSVQHPKQKGGE